MMEEIFFFQYHLHMSRTEALQIPPHERKWLVDRFIEQKKKENASIEDARRKAKAGH